MASGQCDLDVDEWLRTQISRPPDGRIRDLHHQSTGPFDTGEHTFVGITNDRTRGHVGPIEIEIKLQTALFRGERCDMRSDRSKSGSCPGFD